MKRVRPRIERVHREGGPRLRADAGYNVGYGKPPRQHQFRSGESGNRKGRPKGSKNAATTLREILDRKIEVRTGSTIRKIRVLDAILTRFAETALKGDTKAAAFLLQRYDMAGTGPEHANNATTPEEQEIIDAYLATHLKKRAGTA
jgi:hypothetical protein